MTLRRLAQSECTAAELFRAQEAQEESPFLGDLVFWWYLETLAGGLQPAIVIEGDSEKWKSLVRLTEHGRAYAAGDADFVAANGIDRWWGGVHQAGHDARWRWDEETGHVQLRRG